MPNGADGRPRQMRDFAGSVLAAARALSDADIAVYPVDARGSLGVYDIDPLLNRPRTDLGPGAKIREDSKLPDTELKNSEATMYSMAEETGGRAFNDHDLGKTVRRAIDDARVNYTLAFYPNHGRWDGKFHRLKIEVKQPGTRLFYRRGYFATSTAPLDKGMRQQALTESATSPLDATQIEVTTRASISGGDATQYLVLDVQFSPREITFTPAANGLAGIVDLMFVERTEAGKVLVSARGTLDLSMTAERQKVQERPITFSQKLELMPNAYCVRVVVVDAMSGAVGSLTVPLTEVMAPN